MSCSKIDLPSMLSKVRALRLGRPSLADMCDSSALVDIVLGVNSAQQAQLPLGTLHDYHTSRQYSAA